MWVLAVRSGIGMVLSLWLLVLGVPLAQGAGCNLPLAERIVAPCRAAALWTRPPSPPDFIQSHTRVLRLQDDSPYLFIVDTYNTWEPARKSVASAVAETLTIRVNGRRVPGTGMVITPNPIVSLMREDSDGHIYVHGGDITVALNLPELKPDIYAVEVTFNTNAGTPRAFTWAVCVPLEGQCSPTDARGGQ